MLTLCPVVHETLICEKNPASSEAKTANQNNCQPSVSSESECNGGQTTTEQPRNEKAAHPSFVNNHLQDKDQ